MKQMLWTNDPEDYFSPTANRLAAAIAAADDADVVLLHDGSAKAGPSDRRHTVEGVRLALESLIERG
jgi:peptidoglycan/xylan/chitin deacetylase (PgdA/CDA1 family)